MEEILKLIVGLGNPGLKYAFTRHNIGFLSIDSLMDELCIKKLDEEKFNGLFCKTKLDGEDIIISKPLTFMNNSGEFVKQLSQFYKISNNDIIIVYDELAIDFGRIKITKTGSSAGHNGIKSIINYLGTEDFIKVRVGIGPVPEKIKQIDFVLMKYMKDEFAKVKKITDRAGFAIIDIIKNGVDFSMNKYNVK